MLDENDKHCVRHVCFLIGAWLLVAVAVPIAHVLLR